MSHIDVFEVKQCTPEYLEAINHLLRQLCLSSDVMSAYSLQRIIDEPQSHLLLLAVEGRVVGMCTIGFYSSPMGRKAWIEDVVVDEACRGMHLGQVLVERAVDFARSIGFDTLMLTSRPARVAANRLYQKMGFERKQTNVYML